MDLMSIVIILAARCLLIILFLPFSALDKILNFNQAVGQASQAFSARWFARTLILIGLGIEVVMSTAILTGVADRLAALVMAAYCCVTAVLWKQFWKADFRLAGPSRGRDIFWDFLKNFALAGGFLLLTFGLRAADVRQFLEHPWSSTKPYDGAGFT